MADTAVQQSPNLPKTPTKSVTKKTPVAEKISEAPKPEKTDNSNMPSRLDEEVSSQVANTGKFLLISTI